MMSAKDSFVNLDTVYDFNARYLSCPEHRDENTSPLNTEAGMMVIQLG